MTAATINDYADYLHFAWTQHQLPDACRTVRQLVGDDQAALQGINHELNRRLPATVKAPAGNARNLLLDD